MYKRQLTKTAAAGLDGVVGRRRALMGVEALGVVAKAFEARLVGKPGHVGTVSDWRRTLLLGVPKGSGTGEHMSQWRGICVVSVLLKVYEAVLFSLLVRTHLCDTHFSIVGSR